MNEALLKVSHLCVEFKTDQGALNVLDNVSFELQPGKTLGLVGESGCGKSVTSLTIMKLLPQPAGCISSGSVKFKNTELTSLASKQMQIIRGNRIAMIFQEPMTALNPVKTIGKQIMEVYELHRPELSKKQRLNEAVDVLQKVGIPDAHKRVMEFPHQLSGGMRQRVMIAMALACKPDILIADEPTTALDVTIQAQILDLMQSLQKEYGMAILFITHDLGVIAQLCDDVVVMYAGRVVEKSTVKALFQHPKHPYSQGLLNAIPKLNQPRKSQLSTIEGQVPTLQNMPEGCRFYNRCPHKQDNCKTLGHEFVHQENDLYVNCLHWKEIKYEPA
ncbi:MAG: peptide ABC transporter ATP-binding protein [Bermanella sp.]|nr:peptide ABC transporter ATP-binding protein [Bermanella sp.]